MRAGLYQTKKGVLVRRGQEVRPFNAKQVDLVTNFAAQAVIAIENARLLNDLNKLNQQLEQHVSLSINSIRTSSGDTGRGRTLSGVAGGCRESLSEPWWL
jgi:hypothetical protein